MRSHLDIYPQAGISHRFPRFGRDLDFRRRFLVEHFIRDSVSHELPSALFFRLSYPS